MKLKMRKVVKGIFFFIFIVFTLIGGLFGIGIGVSYSHIELAFFALSLPITIIILGFYFYRYKTIRLSFKYTTYLLALILYSSGIGGGYLYIVNALGLHDSYIVSGPVLEKKFYKGGYRAGGPAWHISFKDENSGKIYEIELSSYKYNKLKIGDNYTEVMYRGSLGLLYR